MVKIKRGRGTGAWRRWSRTLVCPAKVSAFTKACRVALPFQLSIARKSVEIQLSIWIDKNRNFKKLTFAGAANISKMSQGVLIVPVEEASHIGKGALAFQVCIGSGKSRS
jgi:acyl CoA:acetate/3-ketoacid CoA transferase alpha subunit